MQHSLITLLKNIDAIDKGNEKYYEQGRALESAAKQADSFSGQMEILTSSFRQFQIEIGKSVVESDLLLSVLDSLFTKGAQTARSFKLINEIGFKAFNEGAQEVANGAESIDIALKALNISAEEFEKSRQISSESWLSTYSRFWTGEVFQSNRDLGEFNNAVALVNAIEGLAGQYDRLAESKTNNTYITEGQTIATDEYGESVKRLTQAFENQINVNDEVNAMASSLTSQIEEYQNIIDSGTTSVYNFATGRYDMLELTEEEILKYKGLVGSLQGYLDQLTNIAFKEDELNRKREAERRKKEKEEKENISLRLKQINEETQAEINAINERAKIESSSPSATADERADIERERQILVSEAYDKKAASIRNITALYEDNKLKVEDAIKAAEKQAEILGSEVISDASKALKEYTSESDKLRQQFEAKEISIEAYNEGLQKSQDNYRQYIETLISTYGVTEEVAAILLELADSYDAVAVSVNGGRGKIEEGKKDWDDFKKEFEDTLWADIASKAIDALGESLGAFNDTALENTKNRLNQELDAVAGRYDIESQILKSQLDNQLITESQYRLKQTELRKAQIAEENSLNKQIFEAEKKQDRNDAGLEGLEAAAQSYIEAFKNYEPVTALVVGSIGAGIAVAQSAAQIGAINQRKFFPKKFAEGGVVNGPSHDQGGVPFTVQGQGGYEMEGGEYIVNKRATSMYRGLLEQINGSVKPVNYSKPVKFANGGIVNNINNINQEQNESVDYLKAIAEATVSTAIGVSKPVRAYVADKDLRGNATERRIRDRNDRI